MARRSYNELVDEVPNAHLVVGLVASAADVTLAGVMVGRLIEVLEPAGDWAIGRMQDGMAYAVHCVFQLGEDADRIAGTVQAGPVDRYAGWASQRSFKVDARARDTISDVLAAAARRMK